MRALVALAALAVYAAHAHQARDPYHLLSYLGIKEPINRLLTCSQNLGPTKCLAALSVWRAKKAIESFQAGESFQSERNGTSDVEQFPWEEYNSTTNEQLYSQLCGGTEKLLQYRKMSFTMFPGYTLELNSKEDGKINVDVLKNDVATARGSMKKLKKQFYNIVPLLLIPGLIMSAILPFMLPAMKLATVASVMLNNMALTGAVFTLLRDNAFNDNYRPKIKYINSGWKNEEQLYHAHEVHADEHEHPHHGGHDEHYEVYEDPKGHYSKDITAYDHVDESTKVVEQPHAPPSYWLNNYKDAVELNLQYNPHKRRG